MTLYDPLSDYENTRAKRYTKKWSILTGVKMLLAYLFVSGTIFSLLLWALNFSAYSARFAHFINPENIQSVRTNLENIIASSSIEVHAASENTDDESAVNKAIIEEKIANTNPGMVWNRSYAPETMLQNIGESDEWSPTIEVAPYENRIIIPKIGKNIPLIDVHHDGTGSYDEMHSVFMEELKKWVVRYPWTARPGEEGNVFIFGHSSNYPWIPSEYNEVFALLDELQNGDEIIVFYHQKKYTYVVNDRATVKPGDTSVLEKRDPKKKWLSLMTCWPIGTTLERLIIFADIKE